MRFRRRYWAAIGFCVLLAGGVVTLSANWLLEAGHRDHETVQDAQISKLTTQVSTLTSLLQQYGIAKGHVTATTLDDAARSVGGGVGR